MNDNAHIDDAPDRDGSELQQRKYGEIEVWHHPAVLELWVPPESGEYRTLSTGEEVELANPLARLISRAIDMIILLPLAILGVIILIHLPNLIVLLVISILGCIGSFVYERMRAAGGRIRGTASLNVGVVRQDNREPPSSRMATKRSIVALIPRVCSIVLWLALIVIQQDVLFDIIETINTSLVMTVVVSIIISITDLVLTSMGWIVGLFLLKRNDYYQGLHDRFAGTIVINIGSGNVNIGT